MKKYVLLFIATVVNWLVFAGIEYLLQWRILKNSVHFTSNPYSTLIVNDLLRMAPWLIAGVVIAACMRKVQPSLGVAIFFLLAATVCFVLATTLTLPMYRSGSPVHGGEWMLSQNMVYVNLFMAAVSLVNTVRRR